MLSIKIKQQDLLSDSKNEAHAKLSAFEYENKASRESNNQINRLNWSSFKEAPYRNPKLKSSKKLNAIFGFCLIS